MTRTYAGQTSGSDYKRHAVSRTDGADTVLQFYAVDAERETATYRVVFSGIALATANSHICQVMAGSSLRVGIKRIRIWQTGTNATTTQRFQYRIYRLTTAGTGGSSITPAVIDPSDSASGATAMTLPSSKGTEGTLIDHGRHLIHATNTTVGLDTLTWDFSQLRDKAIWIAAGTSNGIAIKAISSDSAATVDGIIDIVETAVA